MKHNFASSLISGRSQPASLPAPFLHLVAHHYVCFSSVLSIEPKPGPQPNKKQLVAGWNLVSVRHRNLYHL